MKASLLGAAVAAVAPLDLLGGTKGRPKKGGAELKISLQEGVTPGETLKEKLDFMENHGVVGLEPNGAGLAGRVGELKEALRGREVKISAICAGFGGFILSEDQAVRDEFDRTMREIIAAAGELGSTGVIMVPAFNSQVPAMPHTQSTRDYLIERLCLLGDYARQCGTTVILEPLNRKEAFYLRQVADAASICRDAKNEGVKCMGDFWHMTSEDPSDRRGRSRRQLRGRFPDAQANGLCELRELRVRQQGRPHADRSGGAGAGAQPVERGLTRVRRS